MSHVLNVPIGVPTLGAMLDFDPRTAPDGAALRLENIRVDGNQARSRRGYSTLNGAAFDSKRIIDIFDLLFADATGETLRCVRDATQRSVGGAWSSVTLDSAWTGPDTSRFWSALIPFGSEAKGRIVVGNGVDILKTWQGGAAVMSAYPGGFISRFGIVGDDNRLILGYTTEGGAPYTQRVRWTVVGLVNGDTGDWTNVGAGALDLRNDQWPITGQFKLGGRIFIGKSRALCALIPTGDATSAYGYETLQTNGEGLFARGSLIQFGNLVAFVTHRGISVFDGATLTPILGQNQRVFNDRLNRAALDQITVAIDNKTNRVGWGLPLDGATTPTEIWWYYMENGHWEMDPIPHTALSLYSAVNTVTIDSLAGTMDGLSGTMDSLSGTGVNEPILIFGTNTGTTFQFDGSSKTDNGSLTAATFVSSGKIPVGQTVQIGQKPHDIDEDDYLIVDEVSVRFLDRGDTYSASIEVSGDGGYSWTSLGSITITTGGGTDLRPRIVRVFRTCRCPVKDAIQVRLTSPTSGALWGWTDVTAYCDVQGEKR